MKLAAQRKWSYAALLLAVSAVAWHFSHRDRGFLPAAVVNSPEPSPAVLDGPRMAGPISAPASSSGLPTPRLAEQVDALVKIGSPEAMYSAFKILRKCKLAREDDLFKATRAAMNGPKGPDSAKACDDITGGQMSSMSQYLKIAAASGVHGAAQSVAEEGPAGNGLNPDLPQDDPSVVEYNQTLESAVEAGAKNGDWWSLTAVSQRAELGTHGQPDFEQALNRYVESNAAYKKETGHDFKNYEENIARLKYYISHPHYGEESHSFINEANKQK